MSLSLQEKLEKIKREYPLVPHTNAGRLFSTVRRMKAEKDMDIPIKLRSGFAISTRTGKHANEMNEKEWEEFYGNLGEQLKSDYPELYTGVFSKKNEKEYRRKIQEKKAVNMAHWNNFGSGVKCIFNTVLIKFKAITTKYPGGFESFEEKYEGGFQTDGELIVFCFMGSEYHQLINELVESGLQYSEVEHDFCFFEPPFIELKFKKPRGHKNYFDFIEYFYRGKGKERRVWAKLKK